MNYGLCEACPVRIICADLETHPPESAYWGDERVRVAAVGLLKAIADKGHCEFGPEIEGLGHDTDEILVSCDNSEKNVMMGLGDVLDDIRSQTDVTPTVLVRRGTPDELASLDIPRQTS